MKYQIIDHTADFGFQVTAADLPSLFADAVHALFDVIADVPIPTAAAPETLTIHISGDDWPDLMVNWLREALYQWTGEERLVRKADILSISEYALTARLSYEPYDPDRHLVLQEIKAVTYHQIRVAPVSSGWLARVIFDI
jgi:SHS2 domain-containing protein